MAFSMAFRTPTLLKSTERQRGQQVENIDLQEPIACCRENEQSKNNRGREFCFTGSRSLSQFALLKPCAPDLFVEDSWGFGCYQCRCIHTKARCILRAIGNTKPRSLPASSRQSGPTARGQMAKCSRL